MKLASLLLLLPLTVSAFSPKASKCPFGISKKPIQPKHTNGMTADSAADTTLLERLGGEPALRAAVEIFYDRLLDEKSLLPYFEGVSIEKLREHQYNFMAIAFTNIPDDLDVIALITDAHSRLFAMGLDETHFDTVAGHLVGTLAGLGVPQMEIDEAVSIVGPLRACFEREAVGAA